MAFMDIILNILFISTLNLLKCVFGEYEND